MNQQHTAQASAAHDQCCFRALCVCVDDKMAGATRPVHVYHLETLAHSNVVQTPSQTETISML